MQPQKPFQRSSRMTFTTAHHLSLACFALSGALLAWSIWPIIWRRIK